MESLMLINIIFLFFFWFTLFFYLFALWFDPLLLITDYQYEMYYVIWVSVFNSMWYYRTIGDAVKVGVLCSNHASPHLSLSFIPTLAGPCFLFTPDLLAWILIEQLSTMSTINAILSNPAYHDLFAILKGARNGIVYGVTILFPHALIMSVLFGKGEWVF